MPEKKPIELTRDNPIVWARFDAVYYASMCPDANEDGNPDALMKHYLHKGAQAGFSPNRWFDEAFYLASHPAVEALIGEGVYLSGFAHYCVHGYADLSPHWLFDADTYRRRNPALTHEALTESGFVNGYDHYLKFGAVENRCAHVFFEPSIYSKQLDSAQVTQCDGIGAFAHFLMQKWTREAPESKEPRTSRFFDPDWYLATNHDVDQQVQSGQWHSALHQYLVRGKLENRLPCPADDHRDVTPGGDQARDASRPIKINIDRPRIHQGMALEPIVGNLDFVGWAAADQPLSAVEVYVDEQYCGRAHHGMRTPGVAVAFPQFKHGLFSGFRYVGPSPVEEERHAVRILARDAAGGEHSESFDAEFQARPQRDGPWSLRRRMTRSEIDFKLALLRNAVLTPFFVVLISQNCGAAGELQRTRESLDRQVYPHWRCFDHPQDFLKEGRQYWLIRLAPGDKLGVDALLELALQCLIAPTADFIYSDERRLDPTTGLMAPLFKPDWSPDLLLSTNYIGRVWTATAELVQRTGLSWAAIADTDDFDLVLRLTESAASIAHAALVLCESAASPNIDQSKVPHALSGAMRRRNIDAVVERGLLPEFWRIRRQMPSLPTVSIIIPTAGARGLVEQALRSLRDYTNYPRIEVILVDTAAQSDPAPWRTSAYAAANRVLRDEGPFNWSRINNQAANVARGDVFLFLNDDIAITDGDWLRAMVEECQRPEVGVVGARLLYPDGVVQHAGIFLTANGGRHAFHGVPGTAPGPFGLALAQRNVSAVTGACLMVRRETFTRLGGFDERFDMVGNDVEFCQRVRSAGLAIVLTPYATLTHHESVTRAELPEAHNKDMLADYWRSLGCNSDPYYNCNLSSIHGDWRSDAEYTEVIYAPRPLADKATIRRILAIKLDRMGDFILSLPALRRLKERFAPVQLTLLAAPSACPLAALEPAIDRIIAFELFLPGEGVGLGSSALAELSDKLREESFDLSVDLRCHAESRPVLRGSGATWLAGFDTSAEFPWLDIVGIAERDVATKGKLTHMADTLLSFVEKVAASFDPLPAAIAKPSRPVWPETLPLPPSTPLCIAVHPGAGSQLKCWPPEYFATLIDALMKEFDCGFLIVGNAQDRLIGTQITSAVERSSNVVSLIGMTDLQELANVLSQCDLFIGNDSGPHHLAASLGVPTLGIHSGVVDAREWGPMGPSAVAIRRQMYCSPCYLSDTNDCPRSLACMTELTPERVFALAQVMLSGHAGIDGSYSGRPLRIPTPLS